MFAAWLKYDNPKSSIPICWCFFLPLFLLFLLSACDLGIYHTVKPGQNLYRISLAYGVSEAEISRANNISDPTKIRAGTRLYIPGADRVLTVPVVAAAKSAPQKKSSSSVRRQPLQVEKKLTRSTVKQTTMPQRNPVAKTTEKPTEAKKLQWPLRGNIIRSFSSRAKAGSGKGIEIAAKAGSRVNAAEAGKVIYSGDGVIGYGHLIILQHENDLFTIYGFNQQNYVYQGDFVSKGERIAVSGVPPAGGAPRLHFEVRKGKQAVNPILYLP